MPSENIVDHFGNLPDSREDNRWHVLVDIVVIVICASVCGAEKWEDIEAFGLAKEAWLRRFLRLPHGIPLRDAIAWANRAGLTLAQVKVAEKSNEITEQIVDGSRFASGGQPMTSAGSRVENGSKECRASAWRSPSVPSVSRPTRAT